jgi:hypothetical protein
MTFRISKELAWKIFDQEADTISDRLEILDYRLNRLEAIVRELIGGRRRSDAQARLEDSLERARSDHLGAQEALMEMDSALAERADPRGKPVAERYIGVLIDRRRRIVPVTSRLEEVKRLLRRSEKTLEKDLEDKLR